MGQISRFSDGKYSIQLSLKIRPAAKYKIAFILRCKDAMGSRPYHLLFLRRTTSMAICASNNQMEIMGSFNETNWMSLFSVSTWMAFATGMMGTVTARMGRLIQMTTTAHCMLLCKTISCNIPPRFSQIS